MKRTAIYPGTFDPITLGHVDVANRGLKLFDRVVVGVAANPNKQPMFDLDTRLIMVRETFAERSNVEVTAFSGLLVGLARDQHANAILRGLRAASASKGVGSARTSRDHETRTILPARSAMQMVPTGDSMEITDAFTGPIMGEQATHFNPTHQGYGSRMQQLR